MYNKNLKIIAIAISVIVIASAIGYVELNRNNPVNQIKPGKEITINSNVNGMHLDRIVSLDLAATSTLYVLGAFNDLIAIGHYLPYPQNETKNLAEVSCYPEMSPSQIIKLEPDAVIACYNYTQTEVKELLDAGIDYIHLNNGAGSTFKEVMEENILLGKLTGTQKNATLINNWMNKSFNDFKHANIKNNESVFYALDIESNKAWTTGSDTFINSMFNYAHLENIIKAKGFGQTSNENITKGNPEVLIAGSYVTQSDLNTPIYEGTSAYKNNNVYKVVDANIFSEADFRDIFGIEDLIKCVYNKTVNIPDFPLNLEYPPDPSSILIKINT